MVRITQEKPSKSLYMASYSRTTHLTLGNPALESDSSHVRPFKLQARILTRLSDLFSVAFTGQGGMRDRKWRSAAPCCAAWRPPDRLCVTERLMSRDQRRRSRLLVAARISSPEPCLRPRPALDASVGLRPCHATGPRCHRRERPGAAASVSGTPPTAMGPMLLDQRHRVDRL